MRTRIFTIIAFVCAASFSSAAGTIVTDSLFSNILSSQVKFNVYLPSGFDEGNSQYPVVYLLHGLSDNYTAWDKKGNMKLVADELIASGEACKMIIVMPNAGDADVRNVQCGYFNVEDWPYEDFFFNEFVPMVEKKYRAISDKEHRAVMGLSMGGGGSTVYCLKHPDKFSSCFAMSPWLDNSDGSQGRNDAPKNCLTIVCNSVTDNAPIRFLESVSEDTVAQLRAVNWWFCCGDDDRLMYLSVDLHKKMDELGIKNELRIGNGWHNWEFWHLALREALPFASRNFAK